MSVGSRVKKKLKTEPKKYQIQGVRFAEKYGGRVLIADEMGLGKTLQAIGWAAIHPECTPIVIVCPATVKIGWRNQLREHAGLKAQIINGYTGWSLRYEIIRRSKLVNDTKWFQSKEEVDKYVKKRKKKPSFKVIKVENNTNHSRIRRDIIIINFELLNSWMGRLKELKPKLIVCDECHYIKELSSQRTKAFRQLAKPVEHLIALSGTPILSRPVEFFPILNLLRPKEFPSFWHYAWRYCDPKRGYRGGLSYKGASNLAELNQRLSSVVIRRTEEDVPGQLPKMRKIIVPVEISNKKEYDSACIDFLNWYEKQKGKDAAERAARAKHLIKKNKLRELVAKGKIEPAIQWIKNFLAVTDEKLVVFTYHIEHTQRLKKEFPSACLVVGSAKQKEKEKKRFRETKERLCIGRIKSTGTGFDGLQIAHKGLMVEFDWTPGGCDQVERRLKRMGNKAKCVSIYYLIAENTIDKDNWHYVQVEKRKTCDAVLDGKVKKAKGFSLISSLRRQYGEEKGSKKEKH